MDGNEWLDILTESEDGTLQDVLEGLEIPFLIEADADGSLVLESELVGLITEANLNKGQLDQALKRLRRLGWNAKGRTAKQLVDMSKGQRFINHTAHLKRLVQGGDGFPGGGGIRDVGIVAKNGQAHVAINGSWEYGGPRERYQATLGFQNFDRIVMDEKLTWPDKSRLLLRDRLKVHCDCKAFRYYYAYTAHKKGFGLYPELRPADVRNPGNKGGICKHLHHVLQYVGGNNAVIASQLKAYYEKNKSNRRRKG